MEKLSPFINKLVRILSRSQARNVTPTNTLPANDFVYTTAKDILKEKMPRHHP